MKLKYGMFIIGYYKKVLSYKNYKIKACEITVLEINVKEHDNTTRMEGKRNILVLDFYPRKHFCRAAFDVNNGMAMFNVL